MKNVSVATRINVPSSSDRLGHVRKAVSDALNGSHVPGETAREIVAGVDETVSEVMARSDVLNIPPAMDLEVTLNQENVQVRITNHGACFDPEAAAFSGVPSLGVELIRKVFHDIRHSYAEPGMNRLVLTRNLAEITELEAV